MKRNLRSRFAPSPSGEMHLGNAWTALLAWLDIRQRGGTMVLRIEDLDPRRSRSIYAEEIMRDLHWLGLDWDEGPDLGGDFSPYRQSERYDLYASTFEALEKRGLVYPCYCSRAEIRSVAVAPHAGETEFPYAGICRELDEATKARLRREMRHPSCRLRVTDVPIRFIDGVYGEQQQNLQKFCGDFIIRRSDGVYAYQMAVVVDDMAMKIGRVVRGSDLLSSTPRQVYLWNLLGQEPPAFFHVPLLYGCDGHRLSKRHGALSLATLRQAGVRPERIIGRMAVWAGLQDRPSDVTAAELVSLFSFSHLPRDPIVVEDSVIFS